MCVIVCRIIFSLYLCYFQCDLIGFFYFSCFLTQSIALYVSIILPVCLTLLINSIVLAVIMCSLTKKKTVKRTLARSQRNEAMRQIRIILIFCIIFSLTWLSGVPLILSDRSEFQYIFCTVNILQGLYIFLAYCVWNQKVVWYWKQLLSGKSIRQIKIDMKNSSFQLHTRSQHKGSKLKANNLSWSSLDTVPCNLRHRSMIVSLSGTMVCTIFYSHSRCIQE